MLFANREEIRLLNSKSTDLNWYYSKLNWKLKLLIRDLLFTTFVKKPPVHKCNVIMGPNDVIWFEWLEAVLTQCSFTFEYILTFGIVKKDVPFLKITQNEGQECLEQDYFKSMDGTRQYNKLSKLPGASPRLAHFNTVQWYCHHWDYQGQARTISWGPNTIWLLSNLQEPVHIEWTPRGDV